MKILITGGHFAPALAVIDEIADKVSVVFVGRKYSLDQEKTFSLEYQEITKRHIPFYNLQTGRLTRLLILRSILNAIKIPLGLYQAISVLTKVKPDLILSFGGYIGFPICFIGFILKIPIFIHEQTIKPGLTNRLIGHLAKKIFISFAEAKECFPPEKVVLSGNPVRKTVLSIHKKPFDLKTPLSGVKKHKPVIYFTGGSLGSHSVNVKIEKILSSLLKKYAVIQQTGSVKEYNDYQRLKDKRNKLANDLKANYYIRDHFFADELGYIYSESDLVVGRSGANTVFELIAWKKPAVFIPLPWSANQEQLKQAMLLQKAGVGEIFQQSQNFNQLLQLIEKVITNLEYYKNNFKNVELLYKENAAKIIVQTILSQKSP
ncbi:UDP-N-acetylglucosamine--N-acetylmuramyl-(pentapeptide) pyrophosphoryl-undecaprenol N-acetylglucosamine transferase [Candidatus Roizmanbacteria bacterium]|nr:UDP-N-acetylglucosamine--N-acetylmuramyl-(pentapeptide) pyrophosphoryl-undecaprenol N-acetylglucosamine transferase [Candidatus Roizmanbacteria bacterium]